MDRMLGFDQQFINETVFLFINVCIIVFVLGKLLYNPVKEFLKKRSDGIKEKLDNAKISLKNADELKLEYENKLKGIEAERAEILDKARKLAKDTEFEIISQAKEEAQIIKNRAMLDIEREEERAKDDMKTQIIELSSIIASRYISKEIDSDTQSKLLEEVIEDLGEVKWQN